MGLLEDLRSVFPDIKAGGISPIAGGISPTAGGHNPKAGEISPNAGGIKLLMSATIALIAKKAPLGQRQIILLITQLLHTSLGIIAVTKEEAESPKLSKQEIRISSLIPSMANATPIRR